MADLRASAGGSVEITQTGPGGAILYQEDRFAVRFSWEFASPPALALVFGPPARSWEGARQAEIYEFVAAEIVRQQAPGRAYEIDLEAGIITILERAALVQPAPAERAQAVTLPASQDLTGQEVEALAAIDDPSARAAVDRALDHHLSIDTRLSAAEAMHRQGRLADLDRVVARELRRLSRPQDGMARALRLAAEQPGERIRQALLWASWNCTDCAPHCAALLLTLTGAAQEPFDDAVQAMLARLGLHNSAYDRQAAFAALCQLVRMELDYDATD